MTNATNATNATGPAGDQDRRCPVCQAAIIAAATGRPARYCGTPCRQAAHRARRRAQEAAGNLRWTRDRIRGDLARVAKLLSRLEESVQAGLIDGQADATGWEQGVDDLARHLAGVAAGLGSAAREHRRTVADYRTAIRIAGDALPAGTGQA
ncbi:hypothetical protein [Acrocarpospora sp. B8E8]|uniref:hypothetical protein n=1 Tax=Acrocarpospora sp. B8E8 TaxID=3153572 RepID=UPI00325D4514